MRLAAKLCLAWGIADVIGWLDSQPKEILDFWEAFDAIEPIGDRWMQTATLSSVLDALMSIVAATGGMKKEIRDWESFMPSRFERSAKPVRLSPAQSADEMQSILAKLTGVG